jgi:hypothetical protein
MALLKNGEAIEFTPLKNVPKMLLFASVKGYRITPEEVRVVIPYLDHYHPSHEESRLIQSFSNKTQKLDIKEMFTQRYADLIKASKRNEMDKECKSNQSYCTVSGGKNKKLRYGSTKTRRTRTKSLRFRN